MQRQINFAVNYRSGIIPLYCSSSTTRRKKEEARRGKGRPPARSQINKMGRQIHFYMQAEDRNAFIEFVQKEQPVMLVEMVGESPEVVPAKLSGGRQWFCLWNKAFLDHFQRERIAEAKAEPYRADETSLPILEFTSSFNATWEGKPALGQGRLFGIFDQYLGKPPGFEKWYESLVRWIRKNYQRSPASMGGYIGPAAYEFYNKGGYLLPQFLPPRTEMWLAEIGKQHSRSKTTLRAARRSRARSPKGS
jgi:hypothetical protein